MHTAVNLSETTAKTILTIDDDEGIRGSFRMFLEDRGYRVLEAATGSIGLELAWSHNPDLVLLDLRIPGIDGFGCLEQLRELNPELPIIIISGTGASNDVVKALNLGAWDFILKPILDLQVLQHSIDKAFERNRLKLENLLHQKLLEEKIVTRTQALESAYQELHSSKQTLEALFNAAPLAILAIDTNRRVTLWNKAAEELFGWTHDEILGQPYPLAGPDKQLESSTNLSLAMTGRQFKGLELIRYHKNGQQLKISISTAPLFNSSSAICGVIIISEDISEKQRLRTEAERYSRLASLGELAAGVAHEINNPNGLILLNLPTLKDFVLDAIDLQQQLAIENPAMTMGGFKAERAAKAFPQLITELEDGARRIKQIVEDLKDFSRQETYQPEESFDLSLSAEKTLRLATNHLKNATDHFSSQLLPQLPAVKGSAQRVEQVILNLLINACEALTSQQQHIELVTGYDPQRQEVYLRVTDNGRGISAEHLPRITDPFYTTRRDTGGTGLGLSVSARIVKEHNGRLLFTSTPGQGTTVSIHFPTASRA
ncbi:MAG TPA: response regulator [Malonomonas sp.]